MPVLSPTRSDRLAALRAEVRAIESAGGGGARECLSFGLDAMDAKLAGGGLTVGALHEMTGERPGLSDDAAATLFAAGIAARTEGTVLWALSRRDLFAPGLAQAGLLPERILYAECRHEEDVLAVMEEGLRHGGLGAVIGEVARAGMTATRRLQLAAEDSETMALMLKRRRKPNEDPLALPSAAVTRWRVGCAPSAPLPADGVGRPRWTVALVRQRGGEPFQILVESTDAEGRLALPAEPSRRAVAPARARRVAKAA